MHTPRWLAISYSFILTLGALIALPNFFTASNIEKIRQYIPFFPDTRVTLGLDLRGGSSLQLEIDVEAMKRERLISLLGEIRTKLRTEKIRPQSVRMIGEAIVVVIPDEFLRQQAVKAFDTLIAPVPTGALSALVNDLAILQDHENGEIHITLTDSAVNYYISSAIDQSLKIIRERIDKVGVVEPSIQRVGKTRIQVQLPGIQNPERLRTLLGTTAKMTFHLVRLNVDIDNPPGEISILPGYKEGSTEHYAVEHKIALDGAALKDARASYEHDTNRPMILFELNHQGAKEFAKISRENIGRPLAIVLDGKVLTAPTIQSVIPNGRGQITGQFTSDDTATLAALLRAGALPAPLKVVEERSIGPDLGADAIKMGLYTGILGFILVAVFIVLLYGKWGLIADVALALHTILTFSAMSLLDATLTLPGIAGIILGIGIAVDANILINECIREESGSGVSALAALERGFKRAFSTIVDANVTIVMTILILLYFGTGPVRGFAITMLLGIIISMFTDVTVVRMIMVWIVRRWKVKVLNIQPLFFCLPQRTGFNFMKARFIGIVTSVILSSISCFLFLKPGLNYGLDFKGGIQLEVATKEATNLAALRSLLNGLQVGEVVLQNIGNDNTVLIRIQNNQGEEEEQTVTVGHIKDSIKILYPDAHFPRIDAIGPKISDDLVRDSILAVLLAAIAMTILIQRRLSAFLSCSSLILT